MVQLGFKEEAGIAVVLHCARCVLYLKNKMLYGLEVKKSPEKCFCRGGKKSICITVFAVVTRKH